jgi:hypothetical protein
VSTEEIAQNLKVSLPGRSQYWAKSLIVPARAFDEKEAEEVRDAHECYRFGVRIISRQGLQGATA